MENRNWESHPMGIAEFTEVQAKLIKPLGSKVDDSIHMIDGAITEILELEKALVKNDEANIKEELGDILFYLAGYTHIHGMNPLARYESAFGESRSGVSVNDVGLETAMRILIKLIDINKGVKVYNRSFELDYGIKIMRVQICSIFDIIINIIEQLGYEPDEIYRKNYEKLHKIRYKDGYSDDAANNRDLDSERKALEE